MISGPIRVCNEIDENIKSHFDNLGLTYQGSCPSEISKSWIEIKAYIIPKKKKNPLTSKMYTFIDQFCNDIHTTGTQFDEDYLTIKSFAQEMDQMFDVNVGFTVSKMALCSRKLHLLIQI